MSYALFEVMNGSFADGTDVSESADVLADSVQDHLSRLLNARQGMVRHLAEHGMPDLPALYGDLPYSADSLAQAVKRTVERYEPRLDRVRVRIVSARARDGVLGIQISGCLPGGRRARFQSEFRAEGSADVRPVMGETGN